MISTPPYVEELTSPWGMFLLCSVFPLTLHKTLDVFCPFFGFVLPWRWEVPQILATTLELRKLLALQPHRVLSGSMVALQASNAPVVSSLCAAFILKVFPDTGACLLPVWWIPLGFTLIFRDCSVSTSAISVSAVVKCCSSKLSPFSC